VSGSPDASTHNLRKLYLTEGPEGPVAAGGPSCDPAASEADVASGAAIPCLRFDTAVRTGEIRFSIDPDRYGYPLEVGVRYFLHIPDESTADPFIDVCGEPLRSDGATRFGFTVDTMG